MDRRQLEDYNKIIESLGIKYIKAENIKLTTPVTVSDFHDSENTIIAVRKGEVKFGKKGEIANAGELLFIPGGFTTNVTYGYGSKITITNKEFGDRHEEFFKPNAGASGLRSMGVDNFNYMTFEANIFDTVNFFRTLDIAPFVIKSEEIAEIIAEIIVEDEGRKEGRSRVIAIKSEHLVIEVIRYIIDHQLFVEQLATNSTYFKDPRLLDLFKYVKSNLGGNLSNKVLSEVTNVSEDYVGQYFKMLTGMNPQDYIEYQRMQLALDLLRTTKKSIRGIGQEVGYKDTAYFCRRFKMMYGIPAGKMRRRETLMNIK